MTKRIERVRDLDVYKLAFDGAMEIFEISKSFPKEERYSLTDQIRRSSRSVCSNLSEAWRKRKYKAVFINKLTDAEQEAAETQTWLEFALKCNYINNITFERLDENYEHIFAKLITMERKADSFCAQFVPRPSERSSIVHRKGEQ
ncbi:four helix bundle protein [Candidatus Margulisiibacteriota bacterium]